MYYVIDLYEGVELIGVFPTKQAAERQKSQRMRDTDGECMIDIFDDNNKDDLDNLLFLGLI